MNRILRKSLDVKNAFSCGLRFVAAGKIESDPVVEIVATHEPVSHPIDEQHKTTAPRWSLKSVLRSIAVFAYKFVKPIARPVAFRLRRYLIAGLRDALQEDRTGLSVSLEQLILREGRNTLGRVEQLIQNERQKTEASIQQICDEKNLKTLASVQYVIEQERQNILFAIEQLIQRENRRDSEIFAQIIRQDREAGLSSVTSKNNDFDLAIASKLDRIEQFAVAAARRAVINCGAGEILIRTQVGFLLCASSDHAVLALLLETGEMERGTRILIQTYLQPGDVYVDVGANVGTHVLAAAGAMKGQGKIIAFEPFEPTARLLEKTVWINGYSDITELHQVAVSNTAGRQKLFLGTTSGHHSLFELQPSSVATQQPVEVALDRLDGVIASGQHIDLIKIDAEGAELEVVEGGASLIASNPDVALIVEFGPSHLRRVGRTATEWFASFSRLGLDHRVINAETGVLESWTLDALESVESVNLFFARAESAAWGRLS